MAGDLAALLDYVDRFLETNRDSLPLGFSRASVQTIQKCPDALVEVRLMVDPTEDTSHPEPKNVPCEETPECLKVAAGGQLTLSGLKSAVATRVDRNDNSNRPRLQQIVR